MTRLALVTGAAGFLGGHVVRHFFAAGFRVVGIGHGRRSKTEWAKIGLSDWRSCDIDISALADLSGVPDVIVHCAGGSSVLQSIEHPAEDFRRTVNTTREVLEYARLHAAEACIVFPSSAAVYGQVTHLPITETTPLAPISPYGSHKQLSEELCRNYAARYGLKIAVVRLFSVYGPGLRKQLLWEACEKLRVGDTTFAGTGRERRDWLQVVDAVSLLTMAAERASSICPIANGGSGSAMTVEQVLQRLAPLFPEAAPAKFSGVSRPGDPLGYEAEISLARGWGWRPGVGFDRGIADYVQWYLEATALRSAS